jgi:hypothetical protein
MRNPFTPFIAIAKSASCPPRQRYPVEPESLTLPGLPCDASCPKTPPDASQNFAPRTQPLETEDLKTSQMTTPHTPTRCVTGCVRVPPRQHRAFRPAPGLV